MQLADLRGDRWGRRLSLLALVGLLAAWCWYGYGRMRSVSSPDRTSKATESAHLPEPGSAPDSETTFFAEAEPPILLLREAVTTDIVLCVSDALGRPIPDAAVAACPKDGARNISAEAVLGATNTLGELSLPFSGHGSIKDCILAVHARGHVPASILCPDAPGRYAISLASGGTLEIECRDFSFKPLPGVRIAVSKTLFPASIWRDTPNSRREFGSDPAATIWHKHSEGNGIAVFEGLAPGQYQIRAESATHLLASTGTDGLVRPLTVVGHSVSRHLITCGMICIAALKTNVPMDEVLYYQLVGASSHVGSGYLRESIDLYRRDFEAKFPGSNVMVAVAGDASGELGRANFDFWTLRHGRFSCDVPFISIDRFEGPELYQAPQCAQPPTAEVIIEVDGDHEVDRRKLRVELKREMRSVEGIACVEDQPRLVPAGKYVIDCNDREMVSALEIPAFVDVLEGSRQVIALKVKDGLAPLIMDFSVPSIMRDYFRTVSVSSPGQKSRTSRTKGNRLIMWLAPATYQVTARTFGCKSVTVDIVVPSQKPVSTRFAMEAGR